MNDMKHEKNAKSDIPVILLAAGGSRRMGEKSKQVLEIYGKPLIIHSLELCRKSCKQVIVVEGAVPLEEYTERYPGVELVCNEKWKDGQLGSLQRGINHLIGNAGPSSVDLRCFIMLADLVLVQPSTFFVLADVIVDDSFEAGSVFPVYQGRRGHPVLIGRAAMELVLAAGPSQKAMDVIAPLGSMAVEVDDPGIYNDIDTPEEFMKIRAGFQDNTVKY